MLTFSRYRGRDTRTIRNIIGGGESTGGGSITNPGTFNAQTGTFSIEWDAIPSASPIDVVTGVSNGAPTAFSNLACTIIFASDGLIKSRSGSTVAAANTVNYVGGVSYHCRMVVDVAAKTYSSWVKAAGQTTETQIANIYAFRTEQNTVPQLDYLGRWIGTGDVNMTNMIGPPAEALAPVVANATFNLATSGTGWAAGKVVGTMTATRTPTAWLITAGDPSDYYDIANNTGTITVTAGGATALSGTTSNPADSLTVRADNQYGQGTPGTATINRAPATSTITHGRQITTTNTGHLAYFDPALGRNVQDSDLIRHTNFLWASDIPGVTNGSTISNRFFEGGIAMNFANLTFRACKFVGGVSGRDPVNGTLYHPFKLEWCTVFTEGYTVNKDTNGAEAVRTGDCTIYRCSLAGCSDGIRSNNTIATECHIRTKGMDPLDHNDGVQSYGGNTSTIQRCNIDCRGVNGVGAPNAALFAADNSTGLMTWHDNWCAGGTYVIRCHENSTYDVQGNEVLNGSFPAPPSGAAASRQVIPASNLTWGTVRPNVVVDANGSVLSTIAKP